MIRSIAIGIALVAALWSGVWFYGRQTILSQIEAQAQAIRDRGGEARYAAAQVGGFPFAYRAEIVGPELEVAAQDAAGVPRVTAWQAPTVAARATITDPGGLEYLLPPEQTLVTRFAGSESPGMTVRVRSNELRARQSLPSETLDFSVTAARIEISAEAEAGIAPWQALDLKAANLDFEGSAPMQKSGGAFDGNYELALESLSVLTLPREGGTDTAPLQVETSAARLRSTGRREGASMEVGFELTEPRLALGGGAAMNARARSARFAASIPVEPSEMPQPFRISGKVTALDLGDLMWSAIDPQGRLLDRNIETLAFEIAGKGVFLPAFFAPDALRGGALPFELRRIEIDRLQIAALGLDIAATGTGQIENALPAGELTLRARGVPTFLEAAVKSGLIPPQQGIMARLMLQNFAQPGETEDELVFEFALREGLTYINGVAIGPAPALHER